MKKEKTHIDRMVKEAIKLEKKLGKACDFFDKENFTATAGTGILDQTQSFLLSKQIGEMKRYLETLQKRIKYDEDKENPSDNQLELLKTKLKDSFNPYAPQMVDVLTDSKGNYWGVFVAIPLSESEVSIGFSICHKEDTFDGNLGYKIAHGRALNPKRTYKLPVWNTLDINGDTAYALMKFHLKCVETYPDKRIIFPKFKIFVL